MRVLNFICNQCAKGTESFHVSEHNGSIIPDNWLTIENASIHNDIKEDRAIIYNGNVKDGIHFCSKECLVNYFFNDLIESNANKQRYAIKAIQD